MRTATCACGQLGVEVEGEPVNITACNCSLCQKRAGAPFGLGSYWERSQVKAYLGESKVYRRSSDSGRTVEHHFCPTCGGNVYWYPELVPNLVGVAVGCFDDPSFPPPRAVSYAPRRYDWVKFPEGIPHNETISIAKT